MKILLVYPHYPDTFWSFRHALKFIGRKASFPPLGLLTVAAMLPGEWEKRLVDMNVRALADEDLAWAEAQPSPVAEDALGGVYAGDLAPKSASAGSEE